jgi:hypothetical protein
MAVPAAAASSLRREKAEDMGAIPFVLLDGLRKLPSETNRMKLP